MICKQLLALFLWCHCYQILLNPILQLVALGLSNLGSASVDGLNPLGQYYVQGSPITASANKVTLTPGQEIALRCNIAEYPDASFTWHKQRIHPFKNNIRPEENRVELTPMDQRYLISQNMLIIKSSTLADVGDYYCQVQGQLDGVAETEKMISVRPRPYIQEFDLKGSTFKSAVVEEGQPLTITCNVMDDYFTPDSIQVTWQMTQYDEADMNDIHSGEDGIVVEPHNKTSVDLRIARVTKEHRRLYKCQASNGITDNSKSIFIRVKNKYTVIWPAVGIILELVILIGVIIVVENRRVEPDKGAHDRKAIHQM